MKALWFAAADMLKRPADERSEELRLSILCAFGQLALEGRRPLYRDTLCSALRGCIAIHGNAALLPGVDRVTLAWTAKFGDGSPATAEIEVERPRSGRRRPPLQVQVGVVVLFVQIGALWLEAQHPCGFPAGATPA
jgi:hypothetical protein